PATEVIASTDTSGEANARSNASASSIPGSVSISQGTATGVARRAGVSGRCGVGAPALGEHERPPRIVHQQGVDELVVRALLAKARRYREEEVMVAVSAPSGEAVLVGNVVRHEDLVDVAVLDEEQDLADAPRVVGHVEGRVVGVVRGLQAEEV